MGLTREEEKLIGLARAKSIRFGAMDANFSTARLGPGWAEKVADKFPETFSAHFDEDEMRRCLSEMRIDLHRFSPVPAFQSVAIQESKNKG